MRIAGVKDLKARLSEYLRAVRAGETILVADRSEVIAELRPATARPQPRGGLETALQALEATGDLSAARLSRPGWAWRPSGLGLPGGAAAVLLDDLRADSSGG